MSVTASDKGKSIKNKRLSLSFEEEDEVPCDLDRPFKRVDDILGLCGLEDPMESLDYEPEDKLMDEIDNTIMEPWTPSKDKLPLMVKYFKPASPLNELAIHEIEALDGVWCPFSFYSDLVNFLIAGEHRLIKNSSLPFLCSACVVDSVYYVFLKGTNSDLLFKRKCGPSNKFWRCYDEMKVLQYSKIIPDQLIVPLFYFICRVLFIPHYGTLDKYANLSRASPLPLFIFNILLYLKFFPLLQKGSVIRVI